MTIKTPKAGLTELDIEFMGLNNKLKDAAVKCLFPLGYLDDFVILTRGGRDQELANEFKKKFLIFCKVQEDMVEFLRNNPIQ